MIRRPPRSTLFPTRRSSDLVDQEGADATVVENRAASRGSSPDEEDMKDMIALIAGAGMRAIMSFMSSDRKSTRLNSSHSQISYAVFCLKKKKKNIKRTQMEI